MGDFFFVEEEKSWKCRKAARNDFFFCKLRVLWVFRRGKKSLSPCLPDTFQLSLVVKKSCRTSWPVKRENFSCDDTIVITNNKLEAWTNIETLKLYWTWWKCSVFSWKFLVGWNSSPVQVSVWKLRTRGVIKCPHFPGWFESQIDTR